MVEVVDVGGKSFFAHYASLLDACGIDHVRVADLDYVVDLDTSLGSLFTVDAKQIKSAINAAPTSLDGQAIVAAIDHAIATKDVSLLEPVWDYVKGRRRKLRSGLSKSEMFDLDALIAAQRGRGIYVLSRGSLEHYLPSGYATKDLDKLIAFLGTDYWPQLPIEGSAELEIIGRGLMGLSPAPDTDAH